MMHACIVYIWPIVLLRFALLPSICVVQRLVGAYRIDLARPAADITAHNWVVGTSYNDSMCKKVDKMYTTKFQCRVVSERARSEPGQK